MAQQTAIEWLFDNLKSHFEHDGDLLEVIQMSFNIAKEMEKEQIADAFNKGKDSDYVHYEDWYNQTYNQNK